MADPRRGEVWLLDWSPGRGSEQLGRRPALVVQTDMANANPRYPNTIVLTISTKGLPVATHVEILANPSNGLDQTSYVKCEQLLTISKQRLERKLGQVSSADMSLVDIALRKVLAL